MTQTPKDPAMSRADGGYISVDRDEAIKKNWEMIQKMSKPGDAQPAMSEADDAHDKEFDAMVTANQWHTDLSRLLEAVKFCTQPGWVWSWHRTKSWSCKYIDVRIDMRDGGFIVCNGEGKRISLEQLKRWGLKKDE